MSKSSGKKTGLSSFIAGRVSASGRKGLSRDWSQLVRLCKTKVLLNIPTEEVTEMLGKEVDEINPELNDYKALAAYGVRAGWIKAEELWRALDIADRSNPLWFLALHSGKTFGETIAPLIAEHYLKEENDGWKKMSTRELYDIKWSPGREISIELKASSEKTPRFQQIRRPTMSHTTGYDYDVLLCLGVYGGQLEWWSIPAAIVEKLIQNDTIKPQHNANKSRRIGSYWFSIGKKERTLLAPYYSGDSMDLRQKLLSLLR